MVVLVIIASHLNESKARNTPTENIGTTTHIVIEGNLGY